MLSRFRRVEAALVRLYLARAVQRNRLDGEFDGNWEWWRENRQPLQAGAFKNGKQVGLWKRYYENGQLWDEGTYEDGKKVGEWKVYDKAGAFKQRRVFKAKR